MKKIICLIALMLFAASYAAAYCKRCTSTPTYGQPDTYEYWDPVPPDYQDDGWDVTAHFCPDNTTGFGYCSVNAGCKDYHRDPSNNRWACYRWEFTSCIQYGACT
jgi:hypothetical protein